MTKEQIEHASVEYARSGKYGIFNNTTKTAFIAGAESRQAEIDQLTKLLKRVVWVWNAPIEERLKPYAEHMADVVLEIEEFLKLNI